MVAFRDNDVEERVPKTEFDLMRRALKNGSLNETCTKHHSSPTTSFSSNYYMDDDCRYFQWNRIKCSDPTSPPRGTYGSSYHVPCTFKFYRVEEPNDGTAMELSDQCTKENLLSLGYKREDERTPILFLKDYLSIPWNDECIANFERCYSVEDDQDIYLPFICTRTSWSLPEEATHLSLSCVEDYEQSLKDPLFLSSYQTRHEAIKMSFRMALGFLYILSTCIAVGCCYRAMFRPYIEVLKMERQKRRHRHRQRFRNKQRRNRDLVSLAMDNDVDDDDENENVSSALMADSMDSVPNAGHELL